MPEKRLIVVSNGTPQMEYVGVTDFTDKEIESSGMLELSEARCLRTILMPQGGSISQDIIMTPIGIARGPITMKLRPTSYWWPDQDEGAMKALKMQTLACEKSELVHRAKDAGIETPG